MTVATEGQASSLGQEFLAGLLGAGIAVGCLLPPLLHLITGPLGPFIGGFVAAHRIPATARSRTIVAMTLATTASGFVGGALVIVSRVASAEELPNWFPDTPGSIGAAAGVVWAYCALLATIGTTVRAASDAKSSGRRG